MREHLLQRRHGRRLDHRLYHYRPAVAAMVVAAILNCGGTIRHRWPAPRTRRPQAEAAGRR
jgi:hypothetical protein